MVLEKLEAKPPGQVVNRKELITVKNDVERESQYQLEPEFLLIVLASLVQNGNITLSVAGKRLDAANLGEATKTPVDQLIAFKHVEKPKGLPLAELVALFELLGLAEGLIRNENTHDEAAGSESEEQAAVVSNSALPSSSAILARPALAGRRRREVFMGFLFLQSRAGRRTGMAGAGSLLRQWSDPAGRRPSRRAVRPGRA